MFSKFKLLRRTLICSRRWKSDSSGNKGRKIISATAKALEHFDDFYKPIFNNKWPSIRLGLLCETKYVAVLNNYSDVESVQTSLENQGALNVRRLFDVQSSKLQEKNELKRKKHKNASPKVLSDTMSELSDKKFEEEHDSLYTSTIKESNSFDQSDRYIDPSVSVSQLYEYVPATEIKGSEDWVPESKHFSYYSTESELNSNIVKESQLRIPENLHVYTFEPGNTAQFPSPKRGETGVSDYYLMDGGSVLPVLALDIQPDDNILDMCAAPGGKSFLCLQTLCPKLVTANDSSFSRLNRIKRIMKQFFYDYEKKVLKGEIKITQEDARLIDAPGFYNKILVDVPCTTDRHSANEDDNNIFKSSRIKERIKIPELQSEILLNALKLVSVGGTVVYSTCSLSPIQNDGVVNMALQKLSEDTEFEVAVVDMSEALEATKIMFRYADIGLRYGHLVVPYLLNNFGPTYFCKLIKLR